MDGIINILKPPGMTSHDVVNVVRRLTGVRRTGHTGTLDPGAAGVLPVCVGKATRVSEYVLQMDKSYRAELSLGRATDTEDAAGQTTMEKPVSPLRTDDIVAVLQEFLGESSQIPPMYSAVKIGGKKLYELARQGQEIEREPRKVNIYQIKLLDASQQYVLFDVTCSRGTYVRTLCREIAERLGTVGHMSFLLRTRVGPFDIHDAWTFEELTAKKEEGRLQETLLPLDTALVHLSKIIVSTERSHHVQNGMAIPLEAAVDDGQQVRLYDCQGNFLAIARIDKEKIKPEKVF